MGAATRVTQEFDPSSASGKRWLEKMANKMATTGTKCQHISNNAPRDICELDVEKRKAGIAVAKKWLDGAADAGREIDAREQRRPADRARRRWRPRTIRRATNSPSI